MFLHLSKVCNFTACFKSATLLKCIDDNNELNKAFFKFYANDHFILKLLSINGY